MADDKQKKTTQDRTQVNVHERYEVDYVAKKLGVTRDQVIEAEQQVGKSREKVEEYLKQHR